ncbi:MAG: signal recognition particle receptor subunit beta [Myxococcota bacterium]|jgi:signal recognition particle receptor subunit beta
MAQLNFARREITTKIVYFGARSAGVSTNVERLAASVLPSRRSSVLAFAPPGDPLQTVCFEVALDGHTAKGFPLFSTIYGVPGALRHPGLRHEVMAGVDAVVFVADARVSQESANIDSLLELERALRDVGFELTDLPMVLQINHCDAADARAMHSVAMDLNPYGFPVHEATAINGTGVRETLDTVVSLLALRISAKLSGESAGIRIEAMQLPEPPDLQERVDGHLAGIQRAEAEAKSTSDPHLRYASLGVSKTIQVRYQNESLRGTRPTVVLGAQLDGEDIVLEIIHERINGGEAQRIQLIVENRPTGMDVLPEPRALMTSTESPTAYLPDAIPFPDPEPESSDWPPLVYGIIGVACGAVLGLLVGVILLY